MIGFIKNCMNRIAMSDDEFALHCAIKKTAKKICIKYLTEYYMQVDCLSYFFAHRKAVKKLHTYGSEKITKLAAIAILQYEQEEVEVQ